jgi:hypothetical protein
VQVLTTWACSCSGVGAGWRWQSPFSFATGGLISVTMRVAFTGEL